jgi:hypothetical protein
MDKSKKQPATFDCTTDGGHDLARLKLKNGDELELYVGACADGEIIIEVEGHERSLGLVHFNVVPSNVTLADWEHAGKRLRDACPELFAKLVRVVSEHVDDKNPGRLVTSLREIAIDAGVSVEDVTTIGGVQ